MKHKILEFAFDLNSNIFYSVIVTLILLFFINEENNITKFGAGVCASVTTCFAIHNELAFIFRHINKAGSFPRLKDIRVPGYSIFSFWIIVLFLVHSFQPMITVGFCVGMMSGLIVPTISAIIFKKTFPWNWAK